MPGFRSKALMAALAPVLLAAAPARADDFKTGSLSIEHPWTRATPGGAQVAGGYMTLINKGSAPDRLVGGSLEAAGKFELHEMSVDNGVMKMRTIGALEIPAGGLATLEPSGKHIMFTGLKRGLKAGEMLEETLVFEHAGKVPVRFVVEAAGARRPASDEPARRAAPSMPGMSMD